MKQERSEINRLKSWAETIMDYMRNSPDLSGEYTDMLYDIMVKCFEKGNMSQIKMLVGDLNESTGGFNLKDRINLNRILMEKFGEDLSSHMAKRMAGVLKRGKIRNDDEFVRVNEWIDHLLYDKDNPDAEQQIKQFNQLLLDYQERAARRTR